MARARRTAQAKRKVAILMNKIIYIFLTLCLIALVVSSISALNASDTVYVDPTASPVPTVTPMATIAPTSTPKPSQRPVYATKEALMETISSKDWDVEVAAAIVACESSWRPEVISKPNKNGSIDCGLFQINSPKGECDPKLLDAEYNTNYAYENKYKKGGWRHWKASFDRGCVQKILGREVF
jgi:Lysozyme like domain